MGLNEKLWAQRLETMRDYVKLSPKLDLPFVEARELDWKSKIIPKAHI